MSRRNRAMTCDLRDCTAPGRLYPCGSRCDAHSPAAVAGHAIPAPDPARTLAGMRAGYRIVPTDDPVCQAEGCERMALLDPERRFCRVHRRPA